MHMDYYAYASFLVLIIMGIGNHVRSASTFVLSTVISIRFAQVPSQAIKYPYGIVNIPKAAIETINGVPAGAVTSAGVESARQ